ncbi:chemotaxis protein CheB [Myxosarcina sp. GI1(2024)]
MNYTGFEIIAIAASAGGLSAIQRVLSELPTDFPASVVIVQHLDRHSRSYMADILKRRISLTVKQAVEGERLEAGTVYIAPPNYHLLISANKIVSLSQTKLVHFVRPSADLLFNSVAASYGQKAIAVVLTGTGEDGISGVQTIHKMGGKVIAQDRATSDYFGMPDAAIKTGIVDFILPLSEIAPKLISLVMGE